MKQLTIILISFLLLACNPKKQGFEPDPNLNADAITSEFYYQATFNGVKLTLQDTVNTTAMALDRVSFNADSSMYYAVAEAFFGNADTTGPAYGVKFLGAFPNPPQAYELISNLTLGLLPYGSELRDSTYAYKEGIVVYYTDGAGNVWSSDNGTQDQSTSAFSLLELNAVNGVDHQYKFKATFKANLYDAGGNMTRIENGTVSGKLIGVQ